MSWFTSKYAEGQRCALYNFSSTANCFSFEEKGVPKFLQALGNTQLTLVYRIQNTADM